MTFSGINSHLSIRGRHLGLLRWAVFAFGVICFVSFIVIDCHFQISDFWFWTPNVQYSIEDQRSKIENLKYLTFHNYNSSLPTYYVSLVTCYASLVTRHASLVTYTLPSSPLSGCLFIQVSHSLIQPPNEFDSYTIIQNLLKQVLVKALTADFYQRKMLMTIS